MKALILYPSVEFEFFIDLAHFVLTVFLGILSFYYFCKWDIFFI